MMELLRYVCTGVGSILLFVLLTGMLEKPLPLDPCREHLTMVSHIEIDPVKVMCWNQLLQEPRPCKE